MKLIFAPKLDRKPKMRFDRRPKPLLNLTPVKLKFFNPRVFPPKRSRTEWKLIDTNPFGDTDGDGVKNMFDCKPLNRKKQGFEHQYSFSMQDKDIRTVKMPPEMFLQTTWADTERSLIAAKKRDKEKGITPKYKYQYEDGGYEGYKKDFENKPQIEPMIKKMKSKTEALPVPFLEFDKEGLNVGHEGRHTSVAAIKAKLKYIPVTLEIPKGQKLSPEYERLKVLSGKEYKDYSESFKEKEEAKRKKIRIEIEDLDDENNNQIPDKAEKVNVFKKIKEDLKEDLKD